MWKFSRFRPAPLTESTAALSLPGCGWFHVHTLSAQPSGLPLEQEIFPAEGERVALVLLDIGAYQNEDLPPQALERAGAILDAFPGKDLVLRVAYDVRGRGMEREPATLGRVRRHMEQLGPVIQARREHILQLQGIFVGSWGEMHQSKFLSGESMALLTETLDQATGGGFYLAVRTPAQWREIVRRVPEAESRLGLFNDGIFGSPTDLGTYTDREADLSWQAERMERVPVCGEALFDGQGADYRQAAADLARMHVCCLNGVYHPCQLDFWRSQRVKGGRWDGVSGLDYIGRRLGCRFVAKKARVRGDSLEITVENQGFSSLHLPARCLVRAVGEGGVLTLPVDLGPNRWPSGQSVRLAVSLKAARPPVELFLRVELERGECVPFANVGAEEELALGRYS